jgi:mannose-6-phosphate isomerase class I
LHKSSENKELRRSDQYLLPVRKPLHSRGKYDICPSHRISENLIFEGFDSLAERVAGNRFLTIDGYCGAFFHIFRAELDNFFRKKGLNVSWTFTSGFLRPERKISEMTAPFLGGDDPLFGTRCYLDLKDFFEAEKLTSFFPGTDADICVIIGPGASLASWDGPLVYIDVPKNEIQYRSRAGSVTNLGISEPSDPKSMYKTFYFVDWVVQNKYKQNILPFIDVFIDGQRPEMPVWMEGNTLRKSLGEMSRNFFRTRPWFEPGTWGGSWIKENIGGINKDVANYAWSFELITPENGLIIESSALMCEVSFDCLMYQEAEAVLGDSFARYGTYFPIRFDFLDTFDGGNLSLQCHPRPDYMKENFGEDFTQEETYYILDTKDNADVYLGFREDINPEKFMEELRESYTKTKSFDAGKYILRHRVRKHDLLLIPYGTIHGSGKNNLVLEISTTPYIFTFKMYDWLRPDLDGKPRPLNIERGMANLFFERKGDYVVDKLISRPEMISEGTDWKVYLLPTHDTHSYEIRRYHFRSSIEIMTGKKFLVMSMTQGDLIILETENGMRQEFSFAETFVVPAAAGKIRIMNGSSNGEVMLVVANMK